MEIRLTSAQAGRVRESRMCARSLDWPHGMCWFARRAAGWILLAGFAGIAWTWPAASQTRQLTESEVKAGFVFNLTKFVDWPEGVLADVRDPIILCIVGGDPLGNVLNRVVYGQSVRGRTISVRRYEFGQDLRHCQVLFVSGSEQARVSQIVESLRRASVLTVSDADRFAEAGGVVEFAVEGDRVRFIINRDAASQAKLQISAKLLTLGRVISRPAVLGNN
jgi:hypothetical protein